MIICNPGGFAIAPLELLSCSALLKPKHSYSERPTSSSQILAQASRIQLCRHAKQPAPTHRCRDICSGNVQTLRIPWRVGSLELHGALTTVTGVHNNCSGDCRCTHDRGCPYTRRRTRPWEAGGASTAKNRDSYSSTAENPVTRLECDSTVALRRRI